MVFPTSTSTAAIPQSKSSAHIHQQMQYVAAANAIANRRQVGLSVGNLPSSMANAKAHQHGHRQSIISHSMHINHSLGNSISQQLPLVTSPSSGNILHVRKIET